MPTKPSKLVAKNSIITSSAVERLEQCPAAGVYRVAKRPKQGFAQMRGIYIHRFLEMVGEGTPRDEALNHLRRRRAPLKIIATCAGIDIEQLPHGPVELQYAHDVIADTARRLLDMDDLIIEREQYGRADLLSDRGGDPFVVDYKTGDVSEEVPHEHTQLLGLACSVRRDLPQVPEHVQVGLARVHASGEIEWAVSRVSSGQMDSFVTRTRRLHLRVIEDRKREETGRVPDFCKGPECKYCELKPHCPAHK